ncbi:uncharacterized protein LOC128248710 [Octopus bimaculoides]|uniref:uncharacterized protein LOC128248710 n=1 Tax=Octopus bimaculoides TaxID=37653 RepID=UPI0022E7A5CC|nr:uncharacterized protein LOC128248710 [Octopus bimaculoides]
MAHFQAGRTTKNKFKVMPPKKRVCWGKKATGLKRQQQTAAIHHIPEATLNIMQNGASTAQSDRILAELCSNRSPAIASSEIAILAPVKRDYPAMRRARRAALQAARQAAQSEQQRNLHHMNNPACTSARRAAENAKQHAICLNKNAASIASSRINESSKVRFHRLANVSICRNCHRGVSRPCSSR